MSRRSILVIAVLLLCCGVGAWWLSRSHQSADGPVAPVAAATNAPASKASASAAVTPANTAAKSSKASLPADPYARYRLSNTSESLNALLKRDSALVLENARYDISRPLTVNIPVHLRAKDDPGSYIVKSSGKADAAFQARLVAAGLSPVAYFPHDAWLVRGLKSQVDALNGQPGIAAVLPFEPYYKLKSSLLALAVDEQPLPPGMYLNLLLFADAKPATLSALAGLKTRVLAEGPSPFGPVLTVQAPLDSLAALAGLSGVQMIERSAPRTVANDLSRVKLGVAANTVVLTNFYGLTGSNVTVAITDSGVDITHPDLVGRVLTNSYRSSFDAVGHGTHVAAIIAGSGAASATVLSAPPGSLTNASLRGKAPAATIFSTRLDETLDAGLGFEAYNQQQIASTNALISNNSWGKVQDYDYDLAAASYDAAVRDSLPLVQGMQQICYVFSAGNDGGGNDDGFSGSAGSVVSPGTGKNVITVGALEQLRNITNTVVIDDVTNAVWKFETDSDNQVASYSSRGNVGIGVEGDNGRFKPDVVAPGSWVVSAKSGQFDEGAYYSTTNVISGSIENEIVQPGRLNQYPPILVPLEAIQLRIVITPLNFGTNGYTNFPIYVTTGTTPTFTDTVRTNVFSIPSDLPLTPGGVYYFAVGNPTNIALGYTVTTEITVTNVLGDYYKVLKQLNNALGPYYRYESGTSMAAPGVSGVLALMQEYYQSRMQLTNSPALMKALLINGARSARSDYNLQVQNTSINHQGWGLPNLVGSLAPATNGATASSMWFYEQNPTNALATGDSMTRKLTLSTNSQVLPLRVTLVWTDPPGNPAAGVKLVNDLDLIVTNLDTGAVYFGNDIQSGDFNGAWDTNTSPVLDKINNVENVYISKALGTNFSVTVYGRRVNVNAVTSHTNNCVQDYALVISSGNGEVANAITVAEAPVAAIPFARVLYVTNTTALPLLNQTVGANAPLVSGLNGMTNQWQFYVITNYGTNANFTNAAFLTFSPPTLSVPRMGVNSSVKGEFSRAEADIDLYVSTDPALTNLDPVVVGGALRSVGRGGTETIVIADSAPGKVYYIGVKSEDQMGGQYGLLAAFSDKPFSTRDANGNIRVDGFPTPIEIPDGTPFKPGSALVYGIVVDEAKVRRVVVTNTITHENFGDLLGNLSHGTGFSVLNNHSYGSAFTTQTRIYEDNGENDIPGSQHSDGPGSLRNFVGAEAIGQWMLTMVDNGPTSTGRVDNLILTLEPQDILGNGDNLTIQPFSWTYDFVDVPAGATNLTLTVANISAQPLPVDLYIRFEDFPDFTNYTKKATMDPITDTMTLSIYDIPPLLVGTYYIGIYNPNGVVQKVNLKAKIDMDLSGLVPVVYKFSGTIPIKDDAVTTATMSITNDQEIVSTEVGLTVNHARVSDLAIQLENPAGKRV
ncbi:MAG: hypothetical protein RLY20_308, partial [Verrucomicrobiota bacterium]